MSAAPAERSDPPWVRRTAHALHPDPARVVARLFLPGHEAAAPGRSRTADVLARVLALDEDTVDRELAALTAGFGDRHHDLDATWDAHFEAVRHLAGPAATTTLGRRRLVGAYVTQEYGVEAAALFNPSMVPHPDQYGLPPGMTRFVMTVRAIGEGHVSSLELRTGTVGPDGEVVLDDAPTRARLPVVTEPRFLRAVFEHQLAGTDEGTAAVLDALDEQFGRTDLDRALAGLRRTRGPSVHTCERFEQVARRCYDATFPPDSELRERVLMPQGPAEHQGIEDVRMVRCAEPDGTAVYLGTYTAYDGSDISTQLLRTRDFQRLSSRPLSGPGASNKGLALFPRQVGGRYVALSRADRESNAVTTSDDLLHWGTPVVVQRPENVWELVQLGNCGSPVETARGWLVLTHGVGPMRTYGIGALLLDLDDPTRVVGRLPFPLLTARGDERSGYVPNVVYSCGALRHGRTLVLPYGSSDTFTRIALVDLDGLLDALVRPAHDGGGAARSGP